MYVRAQFFFNEFQQGWVETWYLNGPDLQTLTIQAVKVGQALVRLKADTVSLPFFRLVSVDATTPKQTIRFPVGLTGDRPTAAAQKLAGAENEDVTQTCWNLTCGFTDGTHRVIQVRGLLDADVARDSASGLASPSDPLNKALQLFLRDLKGFPVYQQRQDNTVPIAQVLKVQADAGNPGYTQLILDDDSFLTVGNKVHFTGVPLAQLPFLKGQWKIIAENPTLKGVSLPYAWPYINPVTPSKMRIQEVKPIWTSLTSIAAGQFQSRKTGRPTKVTVGRARGVRFRR
jgi:hypothetical protein